MAAFAGVRIQPQDRDPRRLQREMPLQIHVHDAQGRAQPIARDGPRHVAQGEMRRDQRHPQLIVDQQHHGQRRAGSFREIFGVAAEAVAGIHERAFLYGRRHHGRKLAVGATVAGTIEHFNHIGSVAYIRMPRHDLAARRNVQDLDDTAAMRLEEAAWRRSVRESGAGPATSAVAARRSASAATTRSASQSLCAKLTQASGPTPAGSPDVMTMRGMYTAARAYILVST